jgi:hypothetical protein
MGLPPGQLEALTGLTPARAAALRNALANPVNNNQADAFARLFGSNFAVPNVHLAASANVAMSADDKRELAIFEQVIRQIDAATNQRADFATGLERIAMTLPTAGKRLEELTFVPTLVRELQSTLGTAGQGGRLRDFPILVFDQTTDQGIRTANANYLQSLAQQTGARIEHIDLQTIKQFETKLGIQGMFDTTGNDRAGYAGARNIANLLGPLLHRQLQNQPGTSVANVLNNNNQAALKQLLQNTTLTNQDLVLMGDDDASVMPGFFHAKALIAQDNPGSYITTKTFMDGRGTTSA